MTKLKISYFDFDGGRGHTARLALTVGNVPFEDDRINHTQWATRKSEFPFAALPVLYVDGKALAQSNTINRYVGKMTDLYPSDPWQAALCDEIMDAAEDVMTYVGSTFQLGDEEKKAKRLAMVADVFPLYLARFEQRLNAAGGNYFADNRLTIADLKIFGLTQYLKSGMLDHVPTDLVDRVAPALVTHMERVQKTPQIQAYYAKRKTT